MKNKAEYLNFLNMFVETYCDEYKDILDVYDYMKASYDRFRFFHEKFNRHKNEFDFLEAVQKLRLEKCANRRNIYAVAGRVLFHIEEKEIFYFTELILQRANIYKAAEPFESDFLFLTNHGALQDKKYLEPGLYGEVSEKEFESLEKLYLNKDFVLIDKIDAILEKRFKISNAIPELVESVTEPSIFFENTYKIKNLAKWDKELNSAAISFKNQNGVWPGIMLASSQTYRRIDLAANTKSHNIKGDGSGGMPEDPESFVALSGFAGKDYNLSMCINEKLPDLTFKLIHDSGPGGGESIEDDGYDDILGDVGG